MVARVGTPTTASPLGGRPQELGGDVVWEGSYSGTRGAWFVPP